MKKQEDYVEEPCSSKKATGLKSCSVCKTLIGKKRDCLKCNQKFTPKCTNRFLCTSCTWHNKFEYELTAAIAIQKKETRNGK